MSRRTHVPFETLWAMPIDVPYSLLLRDGDLAWSCGQCPLDARARVLDPGDLEAQTHHVCRYIGEVLERGGLTTDAIGKQLLYYVPRRQGDGERMVAIARQYFGERPSLIPVAVPYFYYDGMLIEVDVFASTAIGADRHCVESRAGPRIEVVDGGDLIWASLTSPPGSGPCPPEAVADWPAALAAALAVSGVSLADLLSTHWFVPADGPGDAGFGKMAEALEQARLADDAGAVVGVPRDHSAGIMGELTFARNAQGGSGDASARRGRVQLRSRRRGGLLWISGRCEGTDLDLVGQTEAIMPVIEQALAEGDMDFGDVAKSTALYVGASTPETLHDHMAVRNRYYSKPGPASTGLPVLALADATSAVAIDILAVTSEGPATASRRAPSTRAR